MAGFFVSLRNSCILDREKTSTNIDFISKIYMVHTDFQRIEASMENHKQTAALYYLS